MRVPWDDLPRPYPHLKPVDISPVEDIHPINEATDHSYTLYGGLQSVGRRVAFGAVVR